MGHIEDRWTRIGPEGRRVRTERHGGGKRWRVRWTDPLGRERSRMAKTRDEAEAVLAAMDLAVRRPDYVDPQAARTSRVGDHWEGWIRSKAKLKRSTLQDYESLWRVRVAPAWEAVPCSHVTAAGVEDWIADLRGELSASRVRAAHVVLTGVLERAVRERLMPANPARGTELPVARAAERRYLSHDQVEDLIDAARAAAGPVGAATVAVLAFGGLRMGELLGLQVEDLDLGRRRLWVRREVLELRGGQVVDTPKSHRGRQIPVLAGLADELGELARGRASGQPLLPAPRGGVWWRHRWLERVWLPATTAAGLDGLVPHELRHTAASLAIAAGADVKVVQRMLGHASAAMTLDLYGHLFEDRLDEVAEAVQAARERAQAARSAEAPTAHRRPRPAGNVIDLASRRAANGS